MFELLNIRKTDDLQGYMVDSKPCPTCQKSVTVFIEKGDLWKYNQGAYVQDVLWQYDVDTRERFVTGICGPCWNEQFRDFEFDAKFNIDL